MTDSTAGPAIEPTVAEKAKPWVERLGFGALHHDGFIKTADRNMHSAYEGITGVFNKDIATKTKGVAFARVGAIAAGGAIALGSLKAKDAQGNDRGIVSRGGQALLGIGIAGAGVLAGGRA